MGSIKRYICSTETFFMLSTAVHKIRKVLTPKIMKIVSNSIIPQLNYKLNTPVDFRPAPIDS